MKHIASQYLNKGLIQSHLLPTMLFYYKDNKLLILEVQLYWIDLRSAYCVIFTQAITGAGHLTLHYRPILSKRSVLFFWQSNGACEAWKVSHSSSQSTESWTSFVKCRPIIKIVISKWEWHMTASGLSFCLFLNWDSVTRVDGRRFSLGQIKLSDTSEENVIR